MQVVFVGSVLFCLLGAGATSVPEIPPGEQGPAAPVLPTNTTSAVANTTDDGNSTVPVLQITEYRYFDWPKIGYKIFLEKMFNALQTLKLFLSLDPMLLKITRTYILSNNTDLDLGESNSTDVNNNEISSLEDKSFETEIEPPPTKESRADKNKSSFHEDSKRTSKESKDDDVKKTKTETGGFFSSIVGAAASVFHTLTGWF